MNDILEAREVVFDALEEEKYFQRSIQLIDAIFTQPYTKVKNLPDSGI